VIPVKGPISRGAPTRLLLASDRLAIVWEAKNEENPAGDVGARTAQQAAGHETWVRARGRAANDATVLAVLASDRARLGDGADVHAGDVHIAALDDVRELAEDIVAVLTRVRARGLMPTTSRYGARSSTSWTKRGCCRRSSFRGSGLAGSSTCRPWRRPGG
jgi:hypothetical protein